MDLLCYFFVSAAGANFSSPMPEQLRAGISSIMHSAAQKETQTHTRTAVHPWKRLSGQSELFTNNGGGI